MKAHVLPVFGDVSLGSMTQPRLQAFVNSLHQRGYAPWTIDNICKVLKSCLDGAVDAGLIRTSPYKNIKKPSVFKAKKEMHFLTPPQLEELADAAGEFSTFILIAGWLGLRFGEARGLRRRRVTLRGEVYVEEQLIEPRGHLKLVPLKSEPSRRKLVVPESLRAPLMEHLARRDCSPDDFVFVGTNGAPLRQTWIKRHFKVAVRRTGLPEDFRFHDLRHSAAAFLIHLGAGQYEVQRFLGHASPRTTYENYAHLFQGYEENLGRRLDTLRRAAVDEQRVGNSWDWHLER